MDGYQVYGTGDPEDQERTYLLVSAPGSAGMENLVGENLLETWRMRAVIVSMEFSYPFGRDCRTLRAKVIKVS